MVGAGGLLFLAIASAIALSPIIKRVDPDAHRLGLYDEAVRQYSEWKTRTERAFWLSLNPEAFEREIASLYQCPIGRAHRETAAQQKWWYEEAGGYWFSTANRCRDCRAKERDRVAAARIAAGHGDNDPDE